MKTNLQSIVLMLLLMSITIANAQIPEKKGWWKFDKSSNLTFATIGNDLSVEGAISSVAGPADGNLAVQVEMGSYLIATHGMDPSGDDGDSVNIYSLQIDISVPEIGIWNAIFQTNQENENDASMFINTDNFLGAWRYGYSTNMIEADTWYRIVVSVENGVSYNVYVDGELWVAGVAQAIDSRDALAENLLFFADNDGEDATIKCSEIAIWDVALTPEQAAELGDATTVEVGILNYPKSKNTSVLGKNFPNPFSGITTFPYEIKEAGEVVFHVFDITGKEVLDSHKETKVPGNYNFELNGTSLTNGIYFVQMSANNHTSTQKITISH